MFAFMTLSLLRGLLVRRSEICSGRRWFHPTMDALTVSVAVHLVAACNVGGLLTPRNA